MRLSVGANALADYSVIISGPLLVVCPLFWTVWVVVSVLRRWVLQLSQERHGVTPQSKALTPEQQKIQELEAKISRLEREKAILKKATALLMSDEIERMR